MTERRLRDAREAFARSDWQAALELFEEIGREGGLSAEDLERVALATRWVGRYEEVLDRFERAQAAYVAAVDRRGAARMALALCQWNWDLGRDAVSAGWWQRASDLLEGVAEAPEHGLLQWHRGRSLADRGDVEGQEEAALAAYEIGRRLGDRTVEALGLVDRGHARVAAGHIADGLPLLDEAAAHAMSGELDPMAAGQIYCSVIWACRSRGDWNRARQWTDTVERWCDRERLAYFPGLCRTHRAEVLRMQGELDKAEVTIRAATEELLAASPKLAGVSFGELGEVRLRQGNFAGAREAFRRSMELGWEPQPGLSRLLLAEGDARAAHRALERAFSGSTWVKEQAAPLLGARTSVAVAAGEMETARAAVAELEALAASTGSVADVAAAEVAAAELALADGDAAVATERLVRARRAWTELEAPYEVGTTRVLLARALLEEGDRTGARLELETAVASFANIGAQLDRRRAAELLESLAARPLDPPEPLRPVPASPAPAASVFRKEGDFWTISFEGKSLRLKDSRGIGYVATLLAVPGRDVLAADLAARRPLASGSTAAGDPASVRDLSDAGERLDDQARANYRRRLHELREALEEAEELHHDARAERLREEIDFLARELSAAVGLGGRARREASPAERARQSVTKAIRKAIARIAADHPSLGRLLETTIRTGTFCKYDPDPRIPVSWDL